MIGVASTGVGESTRVALGGGVADSALVALAGVALAVIGRAGGGVEPDGVNTLHANANTTSSVHPIAARGASFLDM